ncbi:precorrin-2 C(20)-methyltransferase [Thermoleptolyngbya sp. M55_K2018_002]|uniref:precorrin-2 C(20)-methyltransferase n=1 Tax=Thermoleptolyngbya sp. M55_K2018_002 TaxID=2747808 RepID=UPI0019D91E18|nr:precorrin-2 C(20)-methyltransferase [Thermoleptolyngbya sp. M55_K2018_002]HIK42095.1 precorrin-2 C(20)-methyltransferase [Thermoleptolyngbya sp. M55_K2018_002]
MTGTLYGVGAGPGDPELISVKGLRLLQSSPVVAFPAGLGGKQGVVQQIVAQWLRPDQVQLALDFPYVQEEATLRQAWETAAAQVWNYLQQGDDVVFVSEGDVSFYSTFTYLAQTVMQQHPEAQVETIPGICSPMAAAAALGLPLTVRAERLVVLPALYTVADLETALDTADVLVLMKVSSVYEQVWPVLERRGLLQHSYVVERASQPTQVIHADLRDRPSLKLPYFSLLLVKCGGEKCNGDQRLPTPAPTSLR